MFLLDLVAQTCNHSIEGQRIRNSRSSLAIWPVEGQLELYETQIFKKVIFVDYSSQYFCCFAFFFFHPYTACNGMWRRPLQWTEGGATDLWGCHAEVVLLVMIDLQMLCRHTTAPASNPSGPAPGLARLICLLAETCRVYCPPPPGLLSNVTLSTKPAGHHTQV